MNPTVAAISFQLRKFKSHDEFLDHVESLLMESQKAGAEFVLLPECFTTPLLPLTGEKHAQAAVRAVAERFTASTVERLRDLAQKNDQVIIAGAQPELHRGRLYQISHIVPPHGEIHWQAKIHLTRTEKIAWKMTEGKRLNRFQMRGLPFGVLVCYDSEFPELARKLSDAGALAIFVPYCTSNRPGYLRVRHCCHARAIENHIYMVTAGTVGRVPTVRQMSGSYGDAAILSPSDQDMPEDGIVAAGEANIEQVVAAKLDLDRLRKVRRYGDVTPQLDRQIKVYRSRIKIRQDP